MGFLAGGEEASQAGLILGQARGLLGFLFFSREGQGPGHSLPQRIWEWPSVREVQRVGPGPWGSSGAFSPGVRSESSRDGAWTPEVSKGEGFQGVSEGSKGSCPVPEFT